MAGNHFQQPKAPSHNTVGHITVSQGLPRGPRAPTGNLDFAILKPFSGRFFSYHPVVPWDGREPLPATQVKGSTLPDFHATEEIVFV